MIILLNGELSEIQRFHYQEIKRALEHSDGYFTTFLIQQGQISGYEYHVNRISNSNRILNFKQESFFQNDLIQLMKFDQLGCIDLNSSPIWRCKFLVWRKSGFAYTISDLDTDSYRILICEPLQRNQQTEIHLVSVEIKRVPNKCLSSEVKWINGSNSIGAQIEAKKKGGNLALISSVNETISCASHSNVMWFHNGQMFTPSDNCDALKGTTQKAFVDFCVEKGIPIHQTEMLNSTKNLNSLNWILLNAVRGAYTIHSYNGIRVHYSNEIKELVDEFNVWFKLNATDLRILEK